MAAAIQAKAADRHNEAETLTKANLHGMRDVLQMPTGLVGINDLVSAGALHRTHLVRQTFHDSARSMWAEKKKEEKNDGGYFHRDVELLRR